MKLFAAGLSHKTAPVEIREQLAVNQGNDRPDRVVAHTRRVPHRPGSARLVRTRMAEILNNEASDLQILTALL
jgi:hypothetical protein